jgi:hypothetical protein
VISEPLKRKLQETLFAHYPIGKDPKAPCIDPIIVGKTGINSGGGSHYDQANESCSFCGSAGGRSQFRVVIAPAVIRKTARVQCPAAKRSFA